MARDPETYIVKLHHYSGATSVVRYGTQEDCQKFADEKNFEYQTDTYKVEKFDPNYRED